MAIYITLSPAYGRDYKSQKALMADWDANKDFIHESRGLDGLEGGGGTYINKPQVEAGVVINFRYQKMAKIMVHKVK